MNFEIHKSMEILSRTPATLTSLLSGLSEGWLHQNEGENTWSPHDVLVHLIHGEKTDWIPRAKIILSNAENKNFVPFDRFAGLDEEQKKPIEALLEEFSAIRTENLASLKSMSIEDSDLLKIGFHPEFGEVRLQELLSTWVVHDLGHIAQISRVMAKQYQTEVGPWIAYLGIFK